MKESTHFRKINLDHSLQVLQINKILLDLIWFKYQKMLKVHQIVNLISILFLIHRVKITNLAFNTKVNLISNNQSIIFVENIKNIIKIMQKKQKQLISIYQKHKFEQFMLAQQKRNSYKQVITNQLSNNVKYQYLNMHYKSKYNVQNMQCNVMDLKMVFYEQMSQFLKQLAGFLKTKYPRSQVIDCAQLTKLIKQINATEEFQYDMLKNSGFCFTSTNEVQITKTIKLFLNKIIDQLEISYPKFKKLIKDNFSQQKDGPIKANLSQQKEAPIKANYKIGRKISQNTAKYTRLQTGTLEVKSAQIQRVLIKWLQDLNQMILHPRQIISQKNQYKFYSLQKGQNKANFNKCTQNRYQQLIEEGLINKIQQKTQQQRIKEQYIKKNYNQFNMNLINIFNLVKHSQHQVSQQEMEVIKFSYYNTDFISWIVEEKLIHSIKALVQVGQQFTDSGFYLDLIKFKTNDLMRCQFFGNKNKIIEIFKKFLRMDKLRQLQIVKIKNRFQTRMGDAMIFFKLPDSFIICQCQLILINEVKGQDGKKLKLIQNINHFLYQLERSPFGVLGQLGVFLKSKAQTVSAYCHQIELSRQKSYKNCLQKHKQDQNIQQQIKPFVCSRCIKFYPKYSNLFKVHQCEQCLVKICNQCKQQKFYITQKLFQNQLYNKVLKFTLQFKETQQYKAIPLIINNLTINQQQKNQSQPNHQDINQFSSKQLYDRKIKQLLDNNTQGCKQKGLQQVFKDKRIIMKDLFKSNKIKVQLIINYLQKQYQSQLKNDQKTMFVLASWKQKQLKLKVYDYNQDENNIVNSYQALEKYQKHQFITVSDYDLLLQIKSFTKIKIADIKKSQKGDGLPVPFFQKGMYIFDGQDKNYVVQKYKKLLENGQNENENYIVYYEFNPFYLIIDFDYSVRASKSQGWVDQYLKTIPDLYLFRKNIQLSNQSIQTKQLSCFDTLQWKKNIKILNLNENKITNISKVLQNCFNLQQLSIKQNKITELVFTVPLPKLKYLNASKNQTIKCVKRLCNIINIQDIDLSDNLIQFIIIDNDDIKLIQEYQKVQHGKKQITNAHQITNGNQNPNKKQGQKQQEKNNNNLLNPKDIIPKNKGKSNKENKDNTSNKKEKNNFSHLGNLLSKKKGYQFLSLSKLNLSQNRLKSIYEFSKSQFPDLFEFLINDNKLIRLPTLQMPKLKKLDASFNKLTMMDELVLKSQLNNLLEFNLSDNKFQKLTVFKNMTRLKKFDISYNFIKKLDDWTRIQYSNLEQFAISQNQLVSVPKLKTPKLQNLYFDLNKIDNIEQFAKGQYPELRELDFRKNRLVQIPQFPLMPNLKRLYLAWNKITTIQQFAKMDYPNIFQFDISYNKLSKLPKLQMSNIRKISIQQNFIQNVEEFALGNYPKLTTFNISYCKTKQPCTVNKKLGGSQDQIVIETATKPKDSQRQTSQRDKFNFSQRGDGYNLDRLINQKSGSKCPTVQDYYKTFLEAQQKVRGYKDDTIYIATHKNAGENLLQQGKFDEAIKQYQEALNLILKVKNEENLEYALTLIDLAKVYDIKQDDENALNNYEKALKIIEKVKGKDNIFYIQSLLKKAKYHAKIQQNYYALIILQQALKIQQKIKRKDCYQCAKIHKRMGHSFFNQGDLQKALESYQRCLKIQIKKGKKTQEVYQTYLKIGVVYLNKGDFNKALQNYQKGIELQKKVKGQDTEAYLANLLKLIELYTKQLMFTQAIEHCKIYCEIIKVKKGQSSQQHIDGLNTLASLYIKLGDKQSYYLALKNYKKILQIQRQIAVNHEKINEKLQQIKQEPQHLQQNKSKAENEPECEEAKSHSTIKNQLTSNQPTKQVIQADNFQQMLNIAPQTEQTPAQTKQGQQTQKLSAQQQHLKQQKRNDYYNMALTYNKVGIVYEALQKNDKALTMYLTCNKILQDIDSNQTQNSIVVLDRIGNIYIKMNQYYKAIEAYQKCLENKKDLYGGYQFNGCIVTLQVLADLCIKVRWHEKAQDYLKLSLKIQVAIAKDYPLIPSTTFKIGQCQLKKAKYSQALQVFQKCLKLYSTDDIKTKQKQSIQLAQTYQKIGQVLDCQPSLSNKKAAQYYRRSLEMKQRLKGSQCAQCIRSLCSLSKVFIQQKNYEKATENINRALKIIQKNSNMSFSQHSILYFNLGKITLQNKNPDNTKAIELFQKSNQLYKKQNEYIFVYLTASQIQIHNVSQNQNQKDSHQTYPIKVVHQPFYPKLLQKLSDCYEVQGKKVESLQKINQAHQIVKNMNGAQNDQAKRLLKKMIQISGQNFVTQIVGDVMASKSRQGKSTQRSNIG